MPIANGLRPDVIDAVVAAAVQRDDPAPELLAAFLADAHKCEWFYELAVDDICGHVIPPDLLDDVEELRNELLEFHDPDSPEGQEIAELPSDEVRERWVDWCLASAELDPDLYPAYVIRQLVASNGVRAYVAFTTKGHSFSGVTVDMIGFFDSQREALRAVDKVGIAGDPDK